MNKKLIASLVLNYCIAVTIIVAIVWAITAYLLPLFSAKIDQQKVDCFETYSKMAVQMVPARCLKYFLK